MGSSDDDLVERQRSLSAEAARYAINVLSVCRVWPRYDDKDAPSDEDVSDEQIVWTPDDGDEALNTNIGGRDAERAPQ